METYQEMNQEMDIMDMICAVGVTEINLKFWILYIIFGMKLEKLFVKEKSSQPIGSSEMIKEIRLS